jgi:hypothetical protein
VGSGRSAVRGQDVSAGRRSMANRSSPLGVLRALVVRSLRLLAPTAHCLLPTAHRLRPLFDILPAFVCLLTAPRRAGSALPLRADDGSPRAQLTQLVQVDNYVAKNVISRHKSPRQNSRTARRGSQNDADPLSPFDFFDALPFIKRRPHMLTRTSPSPEMAVT